jgi:hypothetical protein
MAGTCGLVNETWGFIRVGTLCGVTVCVCVCVCVCVFVCV